MATIDDRTPNYDLPLPNPNNPAKTFDVPRIAEALNGLDVLLKAINDAFEAAYGSLPTFGSAASQPSNAFATSTQGSKADAALPAASLLDGSQNAYTDRIRAKKNYRTGVTGQNLDLLVGNQDIIESIPTNGPSGSGGWVQGVTFDAFGTGAYRAQFVFPMIPAEWSDKRPAIRYRDGSVWTVWDRFIMESGRNVANGFAGLDATGKVPTAQLPSAGASFKGGWNASTNTPTVAAGTGTNGDYYKVTTAGTQNVGEGSTAYAVGDEIRYNGTIWVRIANQAVAASGITLAPTGDVAAFNVQAAIAELSNEKLRVDGAGAASVQATGSSTALTIADHFGMTRNLRHHGANPGNTGDTKAALDAANAAGSEIVFPAGTYRFATTPNFPNGKTCRFQPGAAIVADGVTATIRGLVEAPINQRVFHGDVVGVKDVVGEWWGAIGVVTANDQPAQQAAHNCVEQSKTSDGWLQRIRLLSGKQYGLSSQLTWRVTADNNLRVHGAGKTLGGARLVARDDFSGSAVLKIEGSADSIQQIADFELRDFLVTKTEGSPAADGIVIGDAAKTISGSAKSLIENVGAEGFANGLKLAGKTRLITFRRFHTKRLGQENVNGLLASISNASDLIGDIDFEDGQFEVENLPGANCAKFVGTAGNFTAIAFRRFMFYHAHVGLRLDLSGTAGLNELFIHPGSQFDGFGTAIYGRVNGPNARAVNLRLCPDYIQGFAAKGIDLAATNGALLRDILIDTWMNGIAGGPAIEIANAENVMIRVLCNAINNPTGPIVALSNVRGGLVEFLAGNARGSNNPSDPNYAIPNKAANGVLLTGNTSGVQVIGPKPPGVTGTLVLNNSTGADNVYPVY